MISRESIDELKYYLDKMKFQPVSLSSEKLDIKKREI